MYNKAGDKRSGRGKQKIVGNRDNGISVEGRGMGWGTWGKLDGTTGTFRKENREYEGGGFGVYNGGSRDQDFEWGEIRDGGQQLF